MLHCYVLVLFLCANVLKECKTSSIYGQYSSTMASLSLAIATQGQTKNKPGSSFRHSVLNNQCIYASLKIDKIKYTEYQFLMHSSCSYGANSLQKMLCSINTDSDNTDLYRHLPVVGIDGITYRNRYCAECNYYNSKQYIYWNARVVCDQAIFGQTVSDLIHQVLSSNVCCNIIFIPPVGSTTERCHDTKNDLLIKGRGIQVLNTKSNVSIASSSALINCSYTMDRIEVQFGTFSGLLDFQNDDSKNLKYGNLTDRCTSDFIYDVYFDSCIAVRCMGPLTYRNMKCASIYETVRGIKFELIIKAEIVNGSILLDSTKSIRRLAVQTISLLKEELRRQYIHMCTMDVYFDVEHSQLQKQSDDLKVTYLLIRTTTIIYTYEAIKHITYLLKILSFASNTYSIHIQKIGNISFLTYVDNGRYRSFRNSKYLLDSRRNRLLPRLSYQHFKFCENKTYKRIHGLSVCPYVNLTKAKYGLKLYDDEICFDNSKYFCLSPDKYIEDSISILVCVDDYKLFMEIHGNGSRTTVNDNLQSNINESILSFVCSLISLVCLLISILTYCLFDKLRNLPGKTNMSLMICMMLAHALYQFGMPRTNMGTICIFLGLLTHFCWLATFAWQTACCVHVYRNIFSRFKVSTARFKESKSNCTLMFYHCIALSLAGVFVGINIAVKLKTTGKIGYGGKVCYISDPSMILYTFALPLGLSIILNIVLITIIVIKIQMMPDLQKNIKKERNNLKIYGKLSTLTGFTWLFGFLYEFTGVTGLKYLFILSTASHGMFLMSAFVLNLRVLNMYKSLFMKKTLTQHVNEQMNTRF